MPAAPTPRQVGKNNCCHQPPVCAGYAALGESNEAGQGLHTHTPFETPRMWSPTSGASGPLLSREPSTGATFGHKPQPSNRSNPEATNKSRITNRPLVKALVTRPSVAVVAWVKLATAAAGKGRYATFGVVYALWDGVQTHHVI